LHQVAGEVHVVVLQKEDATVEGLFAGEVDDLANKVLARVVLGMGLAGEEDLQWSVAIGEKGFEALDIAEEQIAAFIGGEAPGKADGQRLGVETGE
tara:strand:- start:272 stop:559 length:288 start_codon:yes stop_codon:yes gene_type:complete